MTYNTFNTLAPKPIIIQDKTSGRYKIVKPNGEAFKEDFDSVYVPDGNEIDPFKYGFVVVFNEKDKANEGVASGGRYPSGRMVTANEIYARNIAAFHGNTSGYAMNVYINPNNLIGLIEGGYFTGAEEDLPFYLDLINIKAMYDSSYSPEKAKALVEELKKLMIDEHAKLESLDKEIKGLFKLSREKGSSEAKAKLIEAQKLIEEAKAILEKEQMS